MEYSKEWAEEQRKRLQEAMLDHRQKMETDPEYRARSEQIGEMFRKYLVTFGNDTED